MNRLATILRALLVSFLICQLCACVDVTETRRFDSDGTLHFKAVMKIDPMFEAPVMEKMRELAASNNSSGVKIDLNQRIDGKAAVVFEADGDGATTELAHSDQPSQLTISNAGFMRRRFEYRMHVAKSPEIPYPHLIQVSLPGSIGRTNGNSIDDRTVAFDVSSAPRGATFYAESTAFAWSLSGAPATNNVDGRGGPTHWIAWAAGLVLASGLALASWGWRRRPRSRAPAAASPGLTMRAAPEADSNGEAAAAAPLTEAAPPVTPPVTPQVAPPVTPPVNPTLPAAHVFCTDCGAKNPQSKKFCLQCGHPLE